MEENLENAEKHVEAWKNSLVNVKEKLYQKSQRWKEDFIQDDCNTGREVNLTQRAFKFWDKLVVKPGGC